jgi:sugar (pentulose or hexulose) kinase
MEKIFDEAKSYLGIEFGSTRIKGVIIDEGRNVIAESNRVWSDHLANGWWSYSLEEALGLLSEVYGDLAAEIEAKNGARPTRLGAIGISGMMHGDLPFAKDGRQLAEFRTWRNTKTEESSAYLSNLFGCNIPQRWSVAHLYEAILRKERAVPDIAFLTTIAGYVHYRLTGMKVVGLDEASGIFPLEDGHYDEAMMSRFDGLLKAHGIGWKLCQVLPQPLKAGAPAGFLSAEGAHLLDARGLLRPGIPFCPPEGDAGTGMVATDSLRPGTGNISVGTSIFLMACLEKPLRKAHPEIDVVATPTGRSAAMVHANTCTSDLDAWVRLFGEFAAKAGLPLAKDKLYGLLLNAALEGESDAGGLLNFNCYSGEPVCGLKDGRPLFVRKPESQLTLGNFMRAQVFSSFASGRLGLDILKKEGVVLRNLVGHGGIFRTPVVAERLLAAALDTPISVLNISSEGGAWGMAILAQYLIAGHGQPLEDFMESGLTEKPVPFSPLREDVEGFNRFLERYKAALPLEGLALDALK